MKGFSRPRHVVRSVALALSVSCVATGVLAQEAAGTRARSDDDLPEIIVTAQFLKQNLQSTPIAITAVNAAMLESRSQVSVEQIANQAPNVTLKSAGASSGPSLIGFIRGVGQTDFNPSVEPGVGLYVDDVYYSTLTGSVLDLLDLDRLEVLRGPQGTLAGKNSIGGSIKLYTKKPDGKGGGYFEAGFGTLNALSVRGGKDFEIVPDTLFARIAGVSRTRDGHVTRLDYGCTHPGSGVPTQVTGGDCVLGKEGGIQYTAGRLSLRWLASESVEVNFSADATRDRSEPPANTLLSVTPSLYPVGIDTDNNPATGYVAGPLFLPPFLWAQTGYDQLWNAPGNLGACRYIAYGPASCDPRKPNDPYVNYATYIDSRVAGSGGSGPFSNASLWTPKSVPPIQTLTAKGASAQIDWQIAQNVQLQSITAYRTYDSAFADDADATPLPGDILLQHLVHTQKSQELRLNSKWGTWLDYTVGGFYFDQQTSEDALVDIPYAALDFVHGPDHVPATTWAVFAHGIFHLTSKADLALGARYTDEKKDYHYARHNPDGTLPCSVGIYNCALIGLDGLVGHFADTRQDYRAAFNYQWADDFMTYAQFSTGYKGGGVNARPFYPQQVLPFNPETLDAYEVGAKSQFLDRSLRVNAAVFFNKYKGIQLGLSDCTGLTGAGFGFPCALPANAGDADVKGAELEFNWYPVDGLELDGSVSTLDFEFKRVDPLTGVPTDGIPAFTPKLKWAFGAQYEIAFGRAGSLTPRVDASYQGAVYTNSGNTLAGRIDSYALVNARLTWRSPEAQGWQVAVEVQNLTDKLYYNTVFDLTAGAGYAGGQPGLARTWMMTIKNSF